MPTCTSTFFDTPSAQRFVQMVLDANALNIREWLERDTADRLRLDGYSPTAFTGRVQLRAMLYAGYGPIDVHGVRVVLKRAPAQPNGFVVLTAFPTRI